MQFYIVHEVPGVWGRLRARAASGFSRCAARRMTERLERVPGLAGIQVKPLTGSVLVRYAGEAARHAVLDILGISGASASPIPQGDIPTLRRASVLPGAGGGGSAARCPELRPFLSHAVKAVAAVLLAAPVLLKGIKALCRGRIGREALDAAAMGVSLLRRDFRAVSLVAVASGVGEVLEKVSRKHSSDSGHVALFVSGVGNRARRLAGISTFFGLVSAGLAWLLGRGPIGMFAALLVQSSCALRVATLGAGLEGVLRLRAGPVLHTILLAGAVWRILRPLLPLSSAEGEL